MNSKFKPGDKVYTYELNQVRIKIIVIHEVSCTVDGIGYSSGSNRMCNYKDDVLFSTLDECKTGLLARLSKDYDRDVETVNGIDEINVSEEY